VKFVGYCQKDDCALAPPRDDWSPIACPDCGRVYELAPSPGVRAGGPVDSCALCGYEHLHLRKDFPRELGLGIVALAAVLTFTSICPPGFFWLPLVIASVIDLLLYQVIPWKVVCYVCDAEYRGAKFGPELKAYDLHTATECARLKWPRAAKPPEPAKA
jgi:hypothetical protein